MLHWLPRQNLPPPLGVWCRDAASPPRWSLGPQVLVQGHALSVVLAVGVRPWPKALVGQNTLSCGSMLALFPKGKNGPPQPLLAPASLGCSPALTHDSLH